jgi:hypothetical protein
MAHVNEAEGNGRVPSTRRIARVAGVFYLITFISSIPAVLLLDPVLHHSNYIVSAGADTRRLRS